ncbi:MAG: N(G),N(G)-dimethylarginine dimethylaminohydrolase [Steroidobacteraceae bacterium]
MSRCELTHLARTPIDVGRAREQHARYAAALASLGCTIVELDEEPDLPDSVFVEDAAVVLDEVAVLTRPGAASRRPEVESVARALAAWRPCVRIESPGTLDGGDVMVVGRDVYVGRSGRTNDAGIAQLGAAIAPFGYRAIPVTIRGCLHLKSAVTCLDPETLLVNDAWVDRSDLPRLRCIAVDPHEPHAANALRVGSTVLHTASAHRTRGRLEAAGFRVLPLDVSEMEKAEGAVTCCSVIIRG